MNDRSGSCPVCLSRSVIVVRVREGYPIQRCKSCQSDSAVLTSDKLPSYDDLYDDPTRYGGYHNLAEQGQTGGQVLYWYQHKMLAEAGDGAGALHIDIGSGLGSFLAVTKKRGWRSLGVDVSGSAAAKAKSLWDIDTFVGNFLDLRQPAGPVGWISAFEVLEHLFDPREFVRKIYDLLSPGGLVTVSTPNGRSRNEQYNCDPILIPPTHINFFSRPGLRGMFEGSGFVTAYDYVKPLPWGELDLPKWARMAILPWLLVDRVFLGHAGNRLLWVGRKPGVSPSAQRVEAAPRSP